MLTPSTSDETEGDVEAKVILPLLTSSELLSIPRANIKSKEYLRPKDIGKGAAKRSGYFPDFSVYVNALPVCIVEAKSPSNSAEIGYGEACLYAHEINKGFGSGTNPCQIVISTNGVDLLAGFWDAEAAITCKISDIVAGSEVLARLREIANYSFLSSIANQTSAKIRLDKFKRPFNQGEGPSLVNSKVGSNSFAADLSPILRRYFTSHGQQEAAEIWERAYISSSEVTTYDKALESFLKDRISTAKSSGKKLLTPTRTRESSLESVIRKYDNDRPAEGTLQLVTGSVGAGKSLFVRRYKEFLQPPEISKKSHWAFLNFNDAPPKLENSRSWVCEEFVRSIIQEGAPIDLDDAHDQERIFSSNIKNRQAYYDRMNKIGDRRGDLEFARDIEQWRYDPEISTIAISRYLHGDRGENLVVVFDNVDRRSASEQLECFQLALWFMAKTRALVILAMRDVTYELHRNEPPLDTYKSGTVFHISPPRFIDVVRRRLELSLEAMEKEAPAQVSYSIASGAQIRYDGKQASQFLRTVYSEIFERPRNIARVIEALAARNVRQSLDMFMSILTSGHMPEDVLTKIALGHEFAGLNEFTLIKILMRGDGRFFTDTSGFIANIFYCDSTWKRPSNFICVEILFWLIGMRKVKGDNGHMGYFSVSRICNELEKLGFVADDVYSACRFLVSKSLIEPDTLSQADLDRADCIKVTASGFIHMRVLSERLEYLSSILPTTAINSTPFASQIFDSMTTENRTGFLTVARRVTLVTELASYLSEQRAVLMRHDGYAALDKSGASYIIGHIASAIDSATQASKVSRPVQLDFLDTI